MKIRFPISDFRWRTWHALLVWLIGTLIAITVIGEHLVWGLLIAVGSGVAFGLVNYLSHQTRNV